MWRPKVLNVYTLRRDVCVYIMLDYQRCSRWRTSSPSFSSSRRGGKMRPREKIYCAILTGCYTLGIEREKERRRVKNGSEETAAYTIWQIMVRNCLGLLLPKSHNPAPRRLYFILIMPFLIAAAGYSNGDWGSIDAAKIRASIDGAN